MIEGYKAYIEVLNELIDEQIESLELLGLKDFAKGINDTYDDIASQLREGNNGCLGKQLILGQG